MTTTFRQSNIVFASNVLDQVAALTDAEEQQAAVQLFDLWQPDWPTDNGEGLLLHQRVFARARPAA